MKEIITEYTYFIPINGISSLLFDLILLYGYLGGAYCVFYIIREWYRNWSIGL